MMIEVKNLNYRYEGAESPALSDVSFSVEKGEFFAVVGHNGSGKSTLAKHFNALLIPESGDVLIDGMNTRDEDKTIDIRQRVGIVFQNPDNQLVTTVVEDDVAFGPENLGVPSQEIRARVDGALKAVGMSEYALGAPHMLSGGQKQRIAIAGMLAMHPEVIVMDEATAMLDPRGRRDVLEIIKHINRENSITVIMITQYMEEAVDADRMAVMADGRLVMLDTPKRVFMQAEKLRSLRLDVPGIATLRDGLRESDVDVPQDILSVEEMAEALCPLLQKN